MTAPAYPPLDLERAAAALAGAPIGHTLDFTPALPTTMAVARAWAQGPSPRSGAVALADEQTAGRGRLDRRWEAPAGSSLLLSILLRAGQMPHEPSRLPLVAGLALLDATARVAPALNTGLKWPNDALVGESPAQARKVAGILIESVLRDGRTESAIVGIGVNVNQAAHELPTVQPPSLPPTSLALELGAPVDRTDLLIALCRAFAAHLAEPDANLVARWRSRLWTLGREVTAHFADGSTRSGLAVDVTPTGALLLETPDGRRQVVEAGDVSLRG